MQMRRFKGLGVILTLSVLAGAYHFSSESMFDTRMNEDIETFLSSFQNAHSEGERAQSLRLMLLETKQNTTSLVGATFAATQGSLLFLSVILWAMTADSGDRKSTRLNSSHQLISYAVFCLKKKK